MSEDERTKAAQDEESNEVEGHRAAMANDEGEETEGEDFEAHRRVTNRPGHTA